MRDHLFDPASLEEGVDIEAKKAQGRDGKGAVPNSLWETYSAFANTDGGIVLLGVEEKDSQFVVVGIKDTSRVIDDFWSTVNNQSKVSANLLSNSDVEVLEVGNHSVISISVPRATRKQRPVYLNNNPLTGTYRRNHTGDYRCSEDEVKGLLAEQQFDERDATRLEHFSLDDINNDTLDAYRNRLASRTPDHPYLEKDVKEFLRLIGGWWKDRASGEDGLTLAGLLMFGTQVGIQEMLPNYFMDYREYDSADTKSDWIDRLALDGAWSGNVYDFYRSVIQRLYRDLQVPFALAGDVRQDDTPVHKALREALVNTLIHADYAESASVFIVKAPAYFGFRNPGRMRVPVSVALLGNASDCRNRSLQKMFSLIGLGEQAGSGIPRVLSHWQSQHYRPPELWENDHPVSTLMRLRTVSLLPAEALATLENIFGMQFHTLDEISRIALVTAQVEGFVSNTRLQQLSDAHARDLTLLLKTLTEKGFLISDGRGPGTTYRLPQSSFVDSAADEPGFTHGANETGSASNDTTSVANDTTSALSNDTSSAAYDTSSDEVERDSELWARLLEISYPVRATQRARPDAIQLVVLSICNGRFLTVAQLSELLDRKVEHLRRHVLAKLIKEKLLERRFPQIPNHERQAYRITAAGSRFLEDNHE